MKTILRSVLLATLVLALFISLQSCKSDACRSVTCLNGGICKDGTCDCPAGLEGSDCGTESYKKFVGTFTVSDEIIFTKTVNNKDDKDSSFSKTYEVQITKGVFDGTVIIHNLDNNNANYQTAKVNKDSITIAKSPFYLTINIAHTYDVTGRGLITGNTITLSNEIFGYYGNAQVVSTLVKK